MQLNSVNLEHCDPIREWWNDRKEMIIADGDEKSRCYPVKELIDSDCNFDLCKFPKEDEEILPPAKVREWIAEFEENNIEE